MIGLRKFLASRVRLRITRPVLIGAEVFARGKLVDVSREQEAALIATACAEYADDFAAGKLHVVPRGAVVRMLPQRDTWRPRNAATRRAPRGSVRLDPDVGGILDQVRGFVDR